MDKFEPCAINFDAVSKYEEFLPSTRNLALEISKNGYFVVADYFKSLTDSDVETLINYTEDPDSISFSEITMLSELLATGEGIDPSRSLEEWTERTNTFVGYIACESLYRKGLIKLYRENMSFGPELKKKILAERL